MKKLHIPTINNKSNIRLGYLENRHVYKGSGSYSKAYTCAIGSSINWQGIATIECSDLHCPSCIFGMQNISKGIDYLIKEGIVKTEDALKFSLDNLSEDKENDDESI